MKDYMPVCLLCLVGCASLPPAHDANSALVAAQAVTDAVCADPIPDELVEPCQILKDSLAKAKTAAEVVASQQHAK